MNFLKLIKAHQATPVYINPSLVTAVEPASKEEIKAFGMCAIVHTCSARFAVEGDAEAIADYMMGCRR